MLLLKRNKKFSCLRIKLNNDSTALNRNVYDMVPLRQFIVNTSQNAGSYIGRVKDIFFERRFILLSFLFLSPLSIVADVTQGPMDRNTQIKPHPLHRLTKNSTAAFLVALNQCHSHLSKKRNIRSFFSELQLFFDITIEVIGVVLSLTIFQLTLASLIVDAITNMHERRFLSV